MTASPVVADPGQVHLDGMALSEQTITLRMSTIQRQARCPQCHQPSTRKHSRYVRTVADLPWLGVTVRVQLHTRRFFCQQPGGVPNRFSVSVSRPWWRPRRDARAA